MRNGQKLTTEPEPSVPAERILVIRLGAVGDVVRTRFAFLGLRERYPDARIGWLIEERAAAALDGIVGLDEIIRVPRATFRLARPWNAVSALRGVVAQLRNGGYTLSVDFHCILKSALLPWLAGIPTRLGYAAGLAREGSHWLLTDHVSSPQSHISRFERNALLVEHLGGRVPSKPPPLRLPPSAFEGTLPERYLVMHPGTSPTTLYKRWAADRYARVARQLQAEYGLKSIVSWGSVVGEREFAQEVVSGAEGSARLAPLTASIAQLLVLYRGAQLFIGSDSGPLHLAALAGLPIVTLFGPTDPIENQPFPGVESRVIRQDVGCNPCRRGCPTRSCMAAVDTEAVIQAARELVAAPSALQ